MIGSRRSGLKRNTCGLAGGLKRFLLIVLAITSGKRVGEKTVARGKGASVQNRFRFVGQTRTLHMHSIINSLTISGVNKVV